MSMDALLKLAEVIDAYRAVPRLMIAGYAVMVAMNLTWFYGLDNPSGQQVTAFSAVLGLAGAITKFYVDTGRDWQK